jgi:hypothetical protein
VHQRPGSRLQPRRQSDRSEAGLLQFRNERVPGDALLFGQGFMDDFFLRNRGGATPLTILAAKIIVWRFDGRVAFVPEERLIFSS